MKTRILVVAAMCFCFSLPVMAADGVISVQSDFSAQETADRFAKIIQDKGLTLFARVNHMGNAANVDLALRPTEVIIFGNPKVGTPLMQCSQSIAIDLPQKALIWEDVNGKVWFTYNDPSYLKARHNLDGCDEVINKVSGVLSNLSKGATSR